MTNNHIAEGIAFLQIMYLLKPLLKLLEIDLMKFLSVQIDMYLDTHLLTNSLVLVLE